MQNLNLLLKILNENNLDFVIVGGFAAIVHGASQVTKDLDICVALSESDVKQLRVALEKLHPKHRMTPQKLSFLEHPQQISSLKNLYLQTDLGIIDILGQITGVGDFAKVAQNAITIELMGFPCKVISLDDLIQAKKAMGSPKDLQTVAELEIIRNHLKKNSPTQ